MDSNMNNLRKELDNMSEEMYGCYACAKARRCNRRFPSIDDFKPLGLFPDINLPLKKDEAIPEVILKYIYGPHYFDKGVIKEDHLSFIRLRLNMIPSFQNLVNKIINVD